MRESHEKYGLIVSPRKYVELMTKYGHERNVREILSRLGLIRTFDSPILDIGFGNGIASIPHLESGSAVIGLDPYEKILSLVDERARRAEIVKGDALSLPFEDRSFDYVQSVYLFQHFFGDGKNNEPVRKFMGEVKRVLKPQGKALIIADPIVPIFTYPIITYASGDRSKQMRRSLRGFDKSDFRLTDLFDVKKAEWHFNYDGGFYTGCNYTVAFFESH